MPERALRASLEWAVVLAMFIVAACSNGTPTHRTRTYDVFAQEFLFHGVPDRIHSGSFSVEFSNAESFPVTHELVVLRLPVGKTVSNVALAARTKGCHDGAPCETMWRRFGQIPAVGSGARRVGTFRLLPGIYAFACYQNGTPADGANGPAHAALGMLFQFEVTP